VRASRPGHCEQYRQEISVNSPALSGTRPIRQQAKQAGLNRWKLETLTALMGIEALQAHKDRQKRNLEAEERHVRRKLWGETEADTMKGEDMGNQTILGDYHSPQPLVIQPQSSSGILVPILCAALGTLGPAGAVGGYLLSRWAAQVPAQQTAAPAPAERITETIRESISIDLGKIPAK